LASKSFGRAPHRENPSKNAGAARLRRAERSASRADAISKKLFKIVKEPARSMCTP
jgi:hypothetical protein